MGPAHACQPLAKVRWGQGRGRPTNVSLSMGFVATPAAGVYAATLFAVQAISEGLRKQSDKIRCPRVEGDR